MATVGSVRIGVSASVGEFTAGLDSVRKRIRKFESEILSFRSAFAAAIAGLGARAIGDQIGAAVVAASDLNEQVSKGREVFGDAASAVEADAARMADAFGAPKKEFLDAASSIGLILKAAGQSRGAAAELSSQFARLALDASSFYNVPLEEAMAALRSGLVGEAEPLRRFGVLLSEDAVKAEAARLGIVALNGKLAEGQKVQARVSLITRGLADAQGDLARTASGAANQMRAFAGRLENLKADAGAAIQPVTDQILNLANAAVRVLAQEVDGLRGKVRAWGEDASAAEGQARRFFESIGSGVGKAGNALQIVGVIFKNLQVTITRVYAAFARLTDLWNSATGNGGKGWAFEAEKGLDALIAERDRLENEPWASEKIERFFRRIRAEADRTAQAVAGVGEPKGTSRVIGGRGGAPSPAPAALDPKAIEEAEKAREDLAGDARKMMEALDREIATFGASNRQQGIFELLRRGASPEAIRSLAEMDSILADMEERQKDGEDLAEKAKSIFEATRTPLEKMSAQAAELSDLLGKGLIDRDTFDRGLMEAGKGLAPEAGGPTAAAALEAGSKDAYSRIVAFRQGGDSAREQLAVLKQIADTGKQQLAVARGRSDGKPKVRVRVDRDHLNESLTPA